MLRYTYTACIVQGTVEVTYVCYVVLVVMSTSTAKSTWPAVALHTTRSDRLAARNRVLVTSMPPRAIRSNGCCPMPMYTWPMLCIHLWYALAST